MVSLNFYQPGTLNADLSFPSEWNELTTPELEAVSRLHLQDADASLHKLAILKQLIILRAAAQKLRLPKHFFQKLDAEQAATASLDLLAFIYDSNDLTKQPYPCLRGHAGPEDDFNNLTCGEFEDCEIFFNQFKAEPGVEPLARLAAALYRPRGAKYIQYEAGNAAYKHYDVEAALPKFMKLDPAILFTIFTWYTGCKLQLPKFFPTAFKSSGKADDEPDFIAFTKCIHGAAGPKNGSRDVIRTTLLKEFLLEMELEAQKIEEQRKQYEALKR